MVTTTSFFRLSFLVSLMEIFILIYAVIIQCLEKEDSRIITGKTASLVEALRNEQLIKSTETAVLELRKAFKEEEEYRRSQRFDSIENAYLFAMTSFANLGNSGLRLTHWQAKLFYVFATPIGFALYVIIVVSVAYCLRDAMIACITKIESAKQHQIRLLNIKILGVSAALCVIIVQIGGTVALITKHEYIDGVYVTMDTMTMIGAQPIVESSPKLYFTFFLSFYFIIAHALILVLVCNLQQASGELLDLVFDNETKTNCLKSDIVISTENYKETLMASFESPGSSTPQSEPDLDKGDIIFPQMWGVAYEFEPDILNEKLMIGQTDRRDSRFSEIFNAQRDLFEPIMERTENLEEDVMSERSSYKSTNDFFQSDHDNEKPGQTSDVGHFGLSSGESTPVGSNQSLTSSFSNISLNEFEDSQLLQYNE
ncbi:uncharacterized protein LOC135681057 [Rhopilema esculentum]|uniref:uncharacterized protein LOC135681057 n=1 Tax=Rhopilema esculentum TaxID=499914 RepID=UPI0031DA7761|eukprot:gene13124-3914_t